MSWLNKINFSGSVNQNTPKVELPEIFPCPIDKGDFVKIDIETIYSRILIDTLEKCHGLPDDKQDLLWDNCLASESHEGLVTMLAKAMRDQAELFLVYDKAVKIIRKATNSEQYQIIEDYKKQASSNVGVYISFKNYNRSKMIKVYSQLEYHSIAALFKSMNLSQAIQIKVEALRASVNVIDSSKAVEQAIEIANSLKAGKDVLIDAKDTIDTTNPDLTSTNSAIELIAKKLSFYLGLPASYIIGLISNSLSDTGNADSKAVERGLKNYFQSIIKPVCKALFGVTLTFKTDDYEGISTVLETLKTFELTSNEFLSHESKLKIVNTLLGLPEGTKGDEPEKTKPVVNPPLGQPKDKENNDDE